MLPTVIVYLEALGAVLVAGMIAYVVVRWALRGRDVALESGVLFLALLLALDPYSFGFSGGDVGFDRRAWQVAATLLSVVALLGVLATIRQRRIQLAGRIAVLELFAFLALNVAYVARDGVATRALRGYGSSPLPLLALVFGTAIRLALVAKLLSIASPSRSPAESRM